MDVIDEDPELLLPATVGDDNGHAVIRPAVRRAEQTAGGKVLNLIRFNVKGKARNQTSAFVRNMSLSFIKRVGKGDKRVLLYLFDISLRIIHRY